MFIIRQRDHLNRKFTPITLSYGNLLVQLKIIRCFKWFGSSEVVRISNLQWICLARRRRLCRAISMIFNVKKVTFRSPFVCVCWARRRWLDERVTAMDWCITGSFDRRVTAIWLTRDRGTRKGCEVVPLDTGRALLTWLVKPEEGSKKIDQQTSDCQLSVNNEFSVGCRSIQIFN